MFKATGFFVAAVTLMALSWGGYHPTLHFPDRDESVGQARTEIQTVVSDIVSRATLCRVNGQSADDAVTYIQGLGFYPDDLPVDFASLRIWTRIIQEECAPYTYISYQTPP